MPWVRSVCAIVSGDAGIVRPSKPIETRYEPAGRSETEYVPSLAEVTVRVNENSARVSVTVAPGAETSIAPNDPSRVSAKKTVLGAVWDASYKSCEVIQSGTPSPFGSAGSWRG